MGRKYFVGVDSGSQSTKVSLIDQDGTVVCSASQPLRPMIHRKPGWVEHPDDDLWDSLKVALRRLLERFDGDPAHIVGLGLCAIRCCRVFLKADGSLAAPVMSWMDVRAYETYQDDPAIAYTGSTSGYLTFRLTGELKDTIANAFQHQFPTDMETWNWSQNPKHFGKFGIPREKLLEMHLPGEILGRVTADAARDTGLPQGLPVVSTANDKAVEALGSGLIEPGTGLLSLGTYITSMVYGEKYRAHTEHFFTNLASVPYRYLYESRGIRAGMGHISWFKKLLGDEFEERARRNGHGSAEELLEEEAQAVPAGSDGLLIAPDWLAPSNALHRKGVMIGLDLHHTRAHIYRALMEGIALRMKNNFDDMNRELGVKPERLIVCGGGSNSSLFMQIVADVFGVTAVRTAINGAAALGAAIAAAVATDHYSTFEEAVERMVHIKDSFHYDEKRRRAYDRINREAFRELPTLLEPTLQRIQSLRSDLDL
ncbi:Sugar (pentulose or hexulose) kinase [Desulfacinum hydrothermale DSM 13146]|uniref:Sugar (Pentulose or hexulose) kinase n=1 Tax=Desulfacinum hydrothermale DSM 13146 TaxID=1121390 RepID=A0A1W1X340_9BACT|nr:FGGY-family carbohydrate kinase [Desulfacinum hydrothermale]SMC18324.1 Sugar (pentulose or hexulose) kinase [Desulfacinum hydrothermale DSM 13146]